MLRSTASASAPAPPGAPPPRSAAPNSLLRRFTEAGLRAEIAEPDRGTLGARIRSHRLVPYQAVVGARETASDTVSLRLRTGRSLDPMPARAAAEHILAAAAPLTQDP